MPKTKEEKKEYMKKYNIENKEKRKEKKKEYDKKYHKENKEKKKEYDKKYMEANKDKIKERKLKYIEYNKEYRKKYNKTDNGKKNNTIHSWIYRSKIKFADRNETEFYYETYINTHRCTWCDKIFKDSNDRCMDHCHICSLPRAIICRSCNKQDIVPCVNCLL